MENTENKKTKKKKVSSGKPAVKKETPKRAAKKKFSSKKTKTKTKPKAKKFKLRKNKDIAIDFAAQVHKKFDTIIKATILFGSEEALVFSAWTRAVQKITAVTIRSATDSVKH